MFISEPSENIADYDDKKKKWIVEDASVYPLHKQLYRLLRDAYIRLTGNKLVEEKEHWDDVFEKEPIGELAKFLIDIGYDTFNLSADGEILFEGRVYESTYDLLVTGEDARALYPLLFERLTALRADCDNSVDFLKDRMPPK